jgi:hypothetical protein
MRDKGLLIMDLVRVERRNFFTVPSSSEGQGSQ